MGFKQKLATMPVEAKASVAYTACSVLQKGISVITLPIFTRLLTTAQYGQVNVYTAWVGFFMIFLSLNLPYGSLNAALATFPEERDRYIASIEGIFVVLAAAFLAVYLPFADWWNVWLGLPTPMVLVMVAEVVASSCLQCWLSRNRFEYRYKRVVAVTIAMTLLSVAASLALVLSFEERGYAKVIGAASVTMAFGFAVGVLAVVRGGGPFAGRFWRYALGFNIPLVAYYLAQAAFNQSDRIIINMLCGASDAGLYGVAYTLGMLLTFVADAIGSSYLPWFYARLDAGEERRDRPVALALASGIALLVLCVVAAAPELMLVFAGEAYAEAAYVVPPVALCVILVFVVRLFDRVLFLWRKRVALVTSAVVAGAANIGLNLLLIPVFGYLAAAWTTLASYVLFCACEYAFARKAVREKGHDYGLWNIPALCAVVAVSCLASAGLMVAYPTPAVRYSALAVLALAAFLLRKRAKELVGRLRAKS